VAPDAVIIDTTGRTIADVVEKVMRAIEKSARVI